VNLYFLVSRALYRPACGGDLEFLPGPGEGCILLGRLEDVYKGGMFLEISWIGLVFGFGRALTVQRLTLSAILVYTLPFHL
jgi:hypothetical protein